MKNTLVKTFDELQKLLKAIRAVPHKWKYEVDKQLAQERSDKMRDTYAILYDKFEKEVLRAGENFYTELDKGNNPSIPSVISERENQISLTGQYRWIYRLNSK